MASGKDTPRQKMISMMYLVLTALLALNISKEVMNSFVVVNSALAKSNVNFMEGNELIYRSFERMKANDPAKAGALYDRAMKAKALASKMDSILREMKVHLVAETEGVPVNIADTLPLRAVESKDNYDIPTYILVGDKEDGSTGKAAELKKMLVNYKTELVSLLPEKEQKDFKTGFEMQAVEGKQNWEVETFYNAPLAASVTILTKLQTDVRNAERDVIKRLYESISEDDFKFDTLAAKVIAPNSYVMLGQEYKADVFVAAFSTTQNPQILTGDFDPSTMQFKGPSDSIKVDRGIGQYIFKPTKEGIVKWGGVINMKKPDGTVKPYPFTSEFMVARPAAVVSADYMNVVYTDVDNPISISVPGVPAEKVKVSTNNGTISKNAKGGYTMKVTKVQPTDISVTAEIDGKPMNMGVMKFRVKQVPNPVLFVGQVAGGGRIKKSELFSALGPIAKFEYFDFNLPLNVTSFKVSIRLPDNTLDENVVFGNKFSPIVINKLRNLRIGQKVFIDEVKIIDGVGKQRKVPDMVLTVI